MIWRCPNCWTKYEIDEKFSEVLKSKKDCKFCVRKDPNLPTTAEISGLFTPEDMRNHFSVVIRCMYCGSWMPHKEWIAGEKNVYSPCSCKNTNYDPRSLKSFRTYNSVVDNKRKKRR